MNAMNDIESAIIELECINKLLLVYTEFYETECPTMEQLQAISPLDALAFASEYADWSHTYFSLISAAHDKIRSVTAELNRIMDNYKANATDQSGKQDERRDKGMGEKEELELAMMFEQLPEDIQIELLDQMRKMVADKNTTSEQSSKESAI